MTRNIEGVKDTKNIFAKDVFTKIIFISNISDLETYINIKFSNISY